MAARRSSEQRAAGSLEISAGYAETPAHGSLEFLLYDPRCNWHSPFNFVGKLWRRSGASRGNNFGNLSLAISRVGGRQFRLTIPWPFRAANAWNSTFDSVLRNFDSRSRELIRDFCASVRNWQNAQGTYVRYLKWSIYWRCLLYVTWIIIYNVM